MTIFWNELKRGKIALLIWTLSIAFMLGICILIFPEMSSQMGELSNQLGQMGGFSQAFGMDQLNFAEFIGFFGIECGNILGLGGGFFAAIIGISALAKEEKEHTAEFLMTHPVSRGKVITEKFCSLLMQLIILNAVVIGISSIMIAVIIEEEIEVKKLALLFLAFFLMEVQVSSITFAISSFINRGSLGIGLGSAAIFYFMNIIANLSEDVEFLKYMTPFGYTDSSYIITEEALNKDYLIVGIVVTIISIIIAYIRYIKKDINS